MAADPDALVSNSGPKVCHLVWINGYWGKWFDHHKKRNWHKGHWKSECSDTAGRQLVLLGRRGHSGQLTVA